MCLYPYGRFVPRKVNCTHCLADRISTRPARASARTTHSCEYSSGDTFSCSTWPLRVEAEQMPGDTVRLASPVWFVIGFHDGAHRKEREHRQIARLVNLERLVGDPRGPQPLAGTGLESINPASHGHISRQGLVE